MGLEAWVHVCMIVRGRDDGSVGLIGYARHVWGQWMHVCVYARMRTRHGQGGGCMDAYAVWMHLMVGEEKVLGGEG